MKQIFMEMKINETSELTYSFLLAPPLHVRELLST